jgi:hypothetical protein
MYEKQTPDGLQKIVSVSTKLATFPSSSTPRELNLVPARREERREMTVRVDERLETVLRNGAEEGGIIIVAA